MEFQKPNIFEVFKWAVISTAILGAITMISLMCWLSFSIGKVSIAVNKLRDLPINTSSFIDNNQITLIANSDNFKFRYGIKLFKLDVKETDFIVRPDNFVILNNKLYIFKPENLVGNDLSTMFIPQ